jgi:hypothetical protein
MLGPQRRSCCSLGLAVLLLACAAGVSAFFQPVRVSRPLSRAGRVSQGKARTAVGVGDGSGIEHDRALPGARVGPWMMSEAGMGKTKGSTKVWHGPYVALTRSY